MSRKPVMTRRIRRHHDEHTNHEAWAIPYGDLVTLLLAFFVVMYAISSVNAGKYRVLSDSLFAAFRGTPRTMEPIQVGEQSSGSGSEVDSAVIQAQLRGQQRSSLAPVPVQGHSAPIASRSAAAAAALTRVADEVERAMDDLVKQNMVMVRRSEFWIEVEIKTDILFPSGSAQLAPYAVDVIQRLGGALAPFDNPIRVEGHTDNKPIKTVAFFSNWELSAARAGSVVRVLQSQGVGPARLAVIGYGEQRPVQSNDTEQGRNANRRVVVVILSTELQRQKASPDQPGVPAGDSLAGRSVAAGPTAPSTGAPDATPVGTISAGQTASPPTAPNSAAAASTPARAQSTAVTPGEPAELPTAHAAPQPDVTPSTSGANPAGMVRAP